MQAQPSADTGDFQAVGDRGRRETRFLAPPTSRQTQGRSRGGASSRTRAVRPERQDAPALQRLRSPAEGGRPLLARPGRRSRGISPPRGWRPGHAPKRRPPGARDRGAAAARWPLALSWKGSLRRGSVELGAAFVLITAPSPKLTLHRVGTR